MKRAPYQAAAKPRAVILLAGAQGTGKTRLARALFGLLEMAGFVVDIFSAQDERAAIKAAARYGSKNRKWTPEEPT